MQIPRIIHQTLPDKSKIPTVVLKNIEYLKSINPGWHHILYDDIDIQEFIFQYYGQRILEIYESINPLYGPARADLFRYLLIFRMGGVYLDIKSGCSKPFDSFIKENDVFLLSYWHNQQGEEFAGCGVHPADGIDSEFQNGHVICAPDHPIMKGVIELVLWNLCHYSKRKHGIGKPGVLRTTGPIAYSRAIIPLLHQHPYRIFDSDADGLIYSALPLSGKAGHKTLFKKHYTRVVVPIVSSNQENILHYVKYKYIRLMRLI